MPTHVPSVAMAIKMRTRIAAWNRETQLHGLVSILYVPVRCSA